MEKKYKGVLLDLDGVIVDTAKFHYMAWKNVALKLGFEFTLEQNERLKGVSRMESMNIVANLSGKEITQSQKFALATQKNEEYVKFIEKLTPNDVLDGVMDFLYTLKKNRIKIVLGSASKNANLVLKKLKLEQIFDGVVDGTTVEKPKPDPQVFKKGAEVCKLKPCECVVFEDAVAGIQAAKKAGCFAVGVGNADILTQADMVVDKLNVKKVFQLFL